MYTKSLFQMAAGLLCICSAALAHAESPTHSWVAQGWEQLANNQSERGMATWQQGVNMLPPDQLLAFLGIYTNRSAAIRQLKRAGIEEQAIILYAAHKGKKAYYVMSVQDVPADQTLRQTQLAPLRKAIGSPQRLYANAASKFQTAISATSPAPEFPVQKNRSSIETARSSEQLQPTANSSDPAMSDDWIDEGWNQLDADNEEAALAAWQQGVNRLPDEQILIFIGAYQQRNSALKQARRAGRQQKAIVVRANFKDSNDYYVLSARDVPANRAARHKQLAGLRAAIGTDQWLYGNQAKKFQSQPRTVSGPPKRAAFTIDSFNVTGNTVVASDKILQRLRPYLGAAKTGQDLAGAKEAISHLYRSEGYQVVAVDLPQQPTNGVVPVRIVEQSGAPASADKKTSAPLPAPQSEKAVTAAEAKPQVPATDRQNSITTSRKLAYHPHAHGSVDIDVAIEEENPFRFGLMASNMGIDRSGRQLFTAIMHHNNLWNLNHQLTLSYTTSDLPKETRLYSARYAIPFSRGGELSLNAAKVNLKPGIVGSTVSTTGNAYTHGLHYEQTLYETAALRHYIDIGYEWHRYKEAFTNLPPAPSFNVEVSANPLVFGYGFERSLSMGEFEFSLDYFYNTVGGVRNNDATYQLFNPAAVAHWSKTALNTSYAYRWLSGWELQTEIGAQLSNNALISGERQFITGMSKVRGFSEVDASGDSAVFIRTQFVSPSWVEDTHFHAFVDAGRYKLNFPLPGEVATDNILSTGLGLLWEPPFNLDLLLEGGFILDGTREVPRHSWGGHFRVVYWIQ